MGKKPHDRKEVADQVVVLPPVPKEAAPLRWPSAATSGGAAFSTFQETPPIGKLPLPDVTKDTDLPAKR